MAARIEIKKSLPSDGRRLLRFTLAMEGQSAAELEAQVTLFLQYAREMNLDPGRGWWCIREGREIYACTCVESPGKTAMLLMPSGPGFDADEDAISMLVGRIACEEAARGIRLGQCLLGTQDTRNAAALRRCGFVEIADLLYLELNLQTHQPTEWGASPAARLDWSCYDSRSHPMFAQLVADTYVGSLDCPALTGLRDIEDALQGHKAAGRFSPHRWLLMRRNGGPSGCILMTAHPLRPVMEIVYMGVHPGSRGLGLGRVLLHQGLSLAHHEGATGVTLAVDAKNEPALRLYREAGFQMIARRRAMIRALSPRSAMART